ncbi:hypothetical protein MXB_4574 [Myxobolus squamalis]|nr:hypothetical protein MXB_4574 [Myxobolus squamalis]
MQDSLVPLMNSLLETSKIEIVRTYVRAVLLMNSIEDIIKIIGAYGLAFQSINSTQEFAYINLSKFIASYTEPYKRLNEEFIFEGILLSLVDDLRMRCSDGTVLEVSHEYNLSVVPNNMALPNHCHFVGL